MGWGVAPPPNGSTELTLDNKGLRRKRGPTRRDLEFGQQGIPKKSGVVGCLWFGNLGRRGLGKNCPIGGTSAGFCLLPEDKAEHGAGPGAGSGSGPSARPEMGTGEGASLALAPLVPTPNLASPLQGQGREEITPHYREKPLVHSSIRGQGPRDFACWPQPTGLGEHLSCGHDLIHMSLPVKGTVPDGANETTFREFEEEAR